MQPTREDGIIFVYTLGVLFSGAYLAAPGSFRERPTLIALLTVTAALWTAYYRWAVATRIRQDEEDDVDPDAEEVEA
mgnify:CR=1 FL=1|jgi:hypothetical protein